MLLHVICTVIVLLSRAEYGYATNELNDALQKQPNHTRSAASIEHNSCVHVFYVLTLELFAPFFLNSKSLENQVEQSKACMYLYACAFHLQWVLTRCIRVCLYVLATNLYMCALVLFLPFWKFVRFSCISVDCSN